MSNGVLSIVFDDNYQNQYDYAWPLMEQRNIPGTFYIRTNTMETSGFMNINELKILQDAGNEIASHSVTHRSFTTLSDEEIHFECNESKIALENNDLIVSNFAYPNGITTAYIDSIVKSYFRTGRTAYVSPYLLDYPIAQFILPGFSSEDKPNELESLKNFVDQIYTSNSWGLILFYNIVPNDYSSSYTTSQEDFESFLDYTISKGIQFLTINQTLNLKQVTITSSRGAVSPESSLYPLGTPLSIEAVAPVVGVGERFVWEGWSGSGVGSYSGLDNSASILLDNPISEDVSWKKQYLFIFDQEGLPERDDLFFNINSESVSLPISLWFDEESIVEFVYPNIIQNDFCTKYIIDSDFNKSLLLSNSSYSITTSYHLQYTQTFFGIIFIVLIIGVLIITIIFLRKKRKI